MCAPKIMEFVNQALSKQNVSRRDLFKTLLAGGAASTLAALPRQI
jgi:hypothetical protein